MHAEDTTEVFGAPGCKIYLRPYATKAISANGKFLTVFSRFYNFVGLPAAVLSNDSTSPL